MSYELLLLLLIGALGGFMGGMFGVGGSVVMIPALNEALGPNQHLYQAACMIVNFFVAGPAVVQHYRAKAIDFRWVLRLVPVALVAVLAGVGISELHVFSGSGEAYLRGLFGLFLAAISGQELWRHWRRSGAQVPAIDGVGAEPPSPSPKSLSSSAKWLRAAAIALPTGFIAGLLGVGGGLIAVPMQHRLLKMPMKQAIANSAGLIVVVSAVGAIAKNMAYLKDVGAGARSTDLAAALIPTAVLFSLLGSRWLHGLPLRLVKVGFFLLLMLASVRLIHGAYRTAVPKREQSSRVGSARPAEPRGETPAMQANGNSIQLRGDNDPIASRGGAAPWSREWAMGGFDAEGCEDDTRDWWLEAVVGSNDFGDGHWHSIGMHAGT